MPQKFTTLKKAKRLKKSSQKWLLRQVNDQFVERAKLEGYRSRAAFKIIEIDEKFKIFKKGKIVLDLGAAPGGWSQIAVKKVGEGNVVALDLLTMDALAGVVFFQQDFLADDAAEKIITLLKTLDRCRNNHFQKNSRRLENSSVSLLEVGAQHIFKPTKEFEENGSFNGGLLPHNKNGKCDVVLSDMAANTIGDSETDHLRIIALLEGALDLAEKVLKKGGVFVGKIFQGGSSDVIVKKLRQNFSSVKYFKPESSRKDSSETYLVALGFKKI